MAAPPNEHVAIDYTFDLIDNENQDDIDYGSDDDYNQDLEDELNDFDGWDNATGGKSTSV